MNTERPIIPSRRSLRTWFLVVLCIKSIWLILFTLLRNPDWHPNFSSGLLAIFGGDTLTYYYPVEQILSSGQYYGMCRMPGILPIYLPLRLVASEIIAHQLIIVLQLIFSSVAAVLLAILSARAFQLQRAFIICILLSCATTFVSIRDVYLLSDSFCISSLITTVYFLSEYVLSKRKMQLVYAGIFLAWAIFLRQITILAVPVAGLFLLAQLKWDLRKTLSSFFIVMIPILLALGTWTLRNKITYGRTVILVAPLNECMYNLTPELSAIRKLIITVGEDFQPWVKGGGAYWFFNQPIENDSDFPFGTDDFTSTMGEPEIRALRNDYRLLSDTSLTSNEFDSLQQSVVSRAESYSSSYAQEHALNYHVGNKFRFAFHFLFPNRIDDIPFPPRNEMNFLQLGIKSWSLISLWLVHAFAICIVAVWLIKRNLKLLIWAMLPFSFVIALSYLGYIEQRYLATSFPFFLLMIAGTIAQWVDRYKKVNARQH
ncbi:MAG: hypothetical protein RL040_1454 [Bacteroidota bacterium]|jgi:hypothetical protein